MRTKILNRLSDKEAQLIEIRRHFHRHPELSFEEKNTADYIKAFYQGKDIELTTDVGGTHGIIGRIYGKKPGRTIAFRADFDALPIQEETELPFVSETPGVMHACGHDGHTAGLMILAETLAEYREELAGNVVIIHQPAEEKAPGGAPQMIEGGCLDGVDAVFGLHFMPTQKVGTVACMEGPAMAARSVFSIRLYGKGGHGSAPHLANDTIVGACQLVNSLQTVVSRKINPFDLGVLTIGNFDGRGTSNIIIDKVTLEGDVRTLSEDTLNLMEQEIGRITKGISETFGLRYEFEFSRDYPVLINEPQMTALARQAFARGGIKELEQIKEMKASTGSEDFSYYLQQVPGSYYIVGSAPEGEGPVYDIHSPKFQLNEAALILSPKTMAAIAAEFLDWPE